MHEPLIDQSTFDRAQAILNERGEDLAHAAAATARVPALGRRALRTLRPRLRRHVRPRQRRRLPLLRLHRPPKVRPQSLRRRAHPREKLETAVLTPTHRHLPRRRTHPRRHQAGRCERRTERTALDRTTRIARQGDPRAERAIDRYQDAFEAGGLNPDALQQRLTNLNTRLDDLHDQDQALDSDLSRPHAHTSRPRSAHRRR